MFTIHDGNTGILGIFNVVFVIILETIRYIQ